MSKQLIFTSAPSGIHPGRSGFQVVAQHHDLPSRLIQTLEKESTYEFADNSMPKPIVCKFFKIEVGEDEYCVLTRIQECGADFTGRPNHIAHHIVFKQSELPACPPSALFTLWKGWRTNWRQKPRYLGNWDRINYENPKQPFYYLDFARPAKTWKTYTDDEGTAALPHEMVKTPLLFPCPTGKEDALLWLIFESQSLKDPQEGWDVTFTNYLCEDDNPARYRWIGCPQENLSAQHVLNGESLSVFSNEGKLQAPDNMIAEIARKPSDNPVISSGAQSAISIAPIDESEYVQEDLFTEKKEVNLGELEQDSAHPEIHPDEDFSDVFADPSVERSVEIPDIDLSKADDPDEMPIKSSKNRLLWLISIPVLLGIVALGVYMTPILIEFINRQLDPTPREMVETVEDQQKRERLETLNLDADSRFQKQIGEIDDMIAKGQFLKARAYLARYRNNPEYSSTSQYVQLDSWYEEQKKTLETINLELNRLEYRAQARQVIPGFDEAVSRVGQTISEVAEDLRPALEVTLEEIQETYKSWLDNVRLKTKNSPVFFIPIGRENTNPDITFSNLPEEAKRWMAALEHFPNTQRIETIEIKVSPFKGLNSFDLGKEEALFLTLWKQNDRSLLSYLDAQIEVIEILSSSDEDNEIRFVWRFQGAEMQKQTENLGLFPEPPLILSFYNKLIEEEINVVMMGGVSQGYTQPAEVPSSFIQFDSSLFAFEVLDPVVNEKLQLFMLPEDRFLRLRSLDHRYHFAWDPATSRFHLYESKDLESKDVREIQDQISAHHRHLTLMERERTIFNSYAFIQKSPLETLGQELLESDQLPIHLTSFEQYFQNQPANYFEYLRAILTHFSQEYTLIRPNVMEKWLAYPSNKRPNNIDSIITYRNLLLRTSKRFRSLLRDEKPDALEKWRSFVTNLEFWMLGEYQDQILNVLSLSAEDILGAKNTDVDVLNRQIPDVKDAIQALQDQLDERSDLSEIENINQWLIEMTSMDSEHEDIPLIFFQ